MSHFYRYGISVGWDFNGISNGTCPTFTPGVSRSYPKYWKSLKGIFLISKSH